MLYTTKNFSGVRRSGSKSSPIVKPAALCPAPVIFPSRHTRAAIPGGVSGTSSDGVDLLMDAREPGFHTVPSTVPASRAKISTSIPKPFVRANPPPCPARSILRKIKTTPRAASIFEIADRTFQFHAWIPCPFGGDLCRDRFGVQLVRWQLLAVVDARWQFCPAFHITACGPGSSPARDYTALIGCVMSDIAQPQLWRLGHRAWKSPALRRALRLCSIPAQPLARAATKSAAHQFLHRLSQPASLIPGHVAPGRHRLKMLTTLTRTCQAGRTDPREHFISLESAIIRLTGCVQFANTEPVASPAGWGCWIPWEKFGLQLKEYPPARLHNSNRHFFAREQRLWTAHAGAVGGTVAAFGLRFPISFHCETLREFTGRKILAAFDPHAEYPAATLILPQAWRGYRAGHILARDVPACESPRLSTTRRTLARMLRPAISHCLHN